MSRIYFHSPSRTVQVSGPERHWAGRLVDRIGLALLDLGVADRASRLRAAMVEPLEPTSFMTGRDLEVFLSVNGSHVEFRLADGTTENAWHVLLNTAVTVGGRPLKLLARLHAQCEVHCWVDGPNRAWLAEVIDEGRKAEVMRAGMGWEALAEFLQSDATEPVVCSYSVTRSFPNEDLAGLSPEAFDAMAPEERWSAAMAGLRASTGKLELTPHVLDRGGFGQGISALELFGRLAPATVRA